MPEEKKKKAETTVGFKPEKKKVETKINKCQSKLCDNEFKVNEKYTIEKFCPVCICAAQTEVIKAYNDQFSTIKKAMGDDFIKNLIIDIEEGKKPKEVTLKDGSKGFVFNPRLFQIAVSRGSRRERRNFEKSNKKK